MGGAKLLKWRLAAEGAKLLKSGAALILSIPRCAKRFPSLYASNDTQLPHRESRHETLSLLSILTK